MTPKTYDPQSKKIILDALLDFNFKDIPETTRFWMIRTKKGYFYEEFLTKNFVALAWNDITDSTNFNDLDALSDRVLINYPEIKRPSLVINKCKNFIYEVKSGDILVIPNKGSSIIAFAIAGDYYEDQNKTVEIEHAVIDRIEDKDIVIHEVNCPYRKRRHIQIVKIISTKGLNRHLYRAISNYHGISNLDTYSTIILDQLYNYYTFKTETHIVFNVKKQSPIGLRELAKFLHSVTDILSTVVPDENISTQLTLESPGNIVLSLQDICKWLADNYLPLIGAVVFLGGGSFLTVKLPGAVQILKDIFTLKIDVAKEKAVLTGIELDNLNKQVEIITKLKQAGIDPTTLGHSFDLLGDCSQSMQIEPTEEFTPSNSIVTEPEDDEDEEQL